MSEFADSKSGVETSLIDAVAGALGIAVIIYDKNDSLISCSSGMRDFFPVQAEVTTPGSRLRDLLGAVYDTAVLRPKTVRSKGGHISRDDWIAERIAVHWRERYEAVDQLADGRWVRLTKRRLPNGCLIATVADVTEQKKRDTDLADLRAQAELAQHILDNLATPVIVKDSALRFVIVNDAFCRILGFHPKNVVGRSASELVDPETAASFEESERAVLETGVPFMLVETINRADGTLMHAITRKRRSGTPGNYYVTISIDDVASATATEAMSQPCPSDGTMPLSPAPSAPDPSAALQTEAASVTQPPSGHVLVLDENVLRGSERVARLKALGMDALVLDRVGEVLAFLKTAAAMGIAVTSVEATPDFADALAQIAGARQNPLIASLLAPSPIHEFRPRAGLAQADRVPPAVPQRRRIKVLVAEDNDVNQIVFEQILDGIGVESRIVGNGELAVAAWKTYTPDIILMDVSMPVMNGLEAAKAIRGAEESANAGRARVPIVAVTAHAMAGDKDRCLAAGMDDYLSKPVSPEKLEAMIGTWIDDSELAAAVG